MNEEADKGAEEAQVGGGRPSEGQASRINKKSVTNSEEYQGEQRSGEHLHKGQEGGIHGFGGAVQVGDVRGEEEGAEEGVGVADGEAARGAGAVGEQGHAAEGGDRQEEGTQGRGFFEEEPGDEWHHYHVDCGDKGVVRRGGKAQAEGLGVEAGEHE